MDSVCLDKPWSGVGLWVWGVHPETHLSHYNISREKTPSRAKTPPVRPPLFLSELVTKPALGALVADVLIPGWINDVWFFMYSHRVTAAPLRLPTRHRSPAAPPTNPHWRRHNPALIGCSRRSEVFPLRWANHRRCICVAPSWLAERARTCVERQKTSFSGSFVWVSQAGAQTKR